MPTLKKKWRELILARLKALAPQKKSKKEWIARNKTKKLMRWSWFFEKIRLINS